MCLFQHGAPYVHSEKRFTSCTQLYLTCDSETKVITASSCGIQNKKLKYITSSHNVERERSNT